MEPLLTVLLILIFIIGMVAAFAVGLLVGLMREKKIGELPQPQIPYQPPVDPLTVDGAKKRPTGSAVLKYMKPADLRKLKDAESLDQQLESLVTDSRDKGTFAL